MRHYFKSTFPRLASAPVEIRAVPVQRGREGSCFPGSCTQGAFCAGKDSQAPGKHCPSEGGTTAPSRGPRRAGSLPPGTHSPWARVGNAHPWVLGSSTQPSPGGVQEGAAGCRQSGGSHLPGTSSYRERTQPALGTQGKRCRSLPRRRACNAACVPKGVHGKPRHPQQPKLERVSLVNINFISFKAKLTIPLQCKNVL